MVPLTCFLADSTSFQSYLTSDLYLSTRLAQGIVGATVDTTAIVRSYSYNVPTHTCTCTCTADCHFSSISNLSFWTFKLRINSLWNTTVHTCKLHLNNFLQRAWELPFRGKRQLPSRLQDLIDIFSGGQITPTELRDLECVDNGTLLSTFVHFQNVTKVSYTL